MEQLLISIIVPVYNAENYLNACIRSILEQTYKNFELILVNDGSLDRSMQICKETSQKDKRVSVINKINEGLVSARKTGILEAQGQYCCFVDSDDWIEADMLENYVEILAKDDYDIIASGFIKEKDNQQSIELNFLQEGAYFLDDLDPSFVKEMIYKDEIGRGSIIPSVSNKLFRTSIVSKNILSVNDRITNGEDGAILFPTILDICKLYVVSRSWYHYRLREDSMSRSLAEDYYQKILLLHKHLSNEMVNRNSESIIMTGVNDYIAKMLYYGMFKQFGIKRKRVWLFPYEKVKASSKVVIYGAGEVGSSYINQIEQNNYCSLEAVVDKKFASYTDSRIKVQSPKVITEISCDYIILAIVDDTIRKKVEEYVNQHKVDETICVISSKPLLTS